MSTYTPLAFITLSSASTSVTFSGYDMTYTDLYLVINSSSSADGTDWCVQFNGDTSSLYSRTQVSGNGSTVASTRASAQTFGKLNYSGYNTTTAGTGLCTASFMNYANTTTYKTVISRGNNAANGTAAVVNLWRSTAAITSINVLTGDASTFSSGSTFSLYGIQAATPKAQGGDIVTTDGTYWYHAFKASGLFTPSSAISADVLVVAGGGGGGAAGGGGGGGGLRALSAQSFSAQNYGVVVGAGGRGSNNNSVKGGSGSNSSISTITASGGGGGGSYDASYQYGLSGGSGGGAGRDNTSATGGAGNAGSYSPVEGYAGGNASNPRAWGGGAGGGGAGAVGGNGTGTGAQAGERGGAGGAGANSYNSITVTSWLTATNTGVSGYLAGGGGGANVGNNNPASGGSGGGGAGCGSSTTAATSGTTNSGGGGGSDTGTGYTSGSGGSGLVIIRYAV